MASSRGTPTRPIRVDLGEWNRFGEAANAQGTDRSALLRAFMSWYLREPGAKMPKRPAGTPTEPSEHDRNRP